MTPHLFSSANGVDCDRCPMPARNQVHAVKGAAGPRLEETPRVGWNAPQTSIQAAAKAGPRHGTFQAHLLTLIAGRGLHHGATDAELESLTRRTHQSVSAARNALMNAGLIEALHADCDGKPVRRLTESGNPAQAWVVSPLGLAYLGPVAA